MDFPSSFLKPFIDAYWESSNPTKRSIDIPIVPDGCIDIINKNGEIFLVGLMDIAMIVKIEPDDHYFGIRFKPSIASLLLDCDVSPFNNQIVSLDKVDVELYDALKEILTNSNHRVEKLNTFFEAKFCRAVLNQPINQTIKIIEKSGGNIKIEALCKETKLNKKQIERLFVKHVGLTPKKFARVVRFFHTHKHLTKEGIDNLCLKVLERGYYDQAHFNREYKKFTSLKPTSELMSIFYNTEV